eukprot:CAMPEP_0177639212 /NCGR_PEP_ID=MMETSP0447-20121125/5902_1 /TAXON_ID=0 /ORGANISM="Stygamoeba regulata, Strain BSH-02190019" /LENGTH=1216 /DNA_ID=CAMNT_0019141227 /DNA_START=37 /DNA_END=3683 /DNA_ORIENTATION=+
MAESQPPPATAPRVAPRIVPRTNSNNNLNAPHSPQPMPRSPHVAPRAPQPHPSGMIMVMPGVGPPPTHGSAAFPPSHPQPQSSPQPPFRGGMNRGGGGGGSPRGHIQPGSGSSPMPAGPTPVQPGFAVRGARGGGSIGAMRGRGFRLPSLARQGYGPPPAVMDAPNRAPSPSLSQSAPVISSPSGHPEATPPPPRSDSPDENDSSDTLLPPVALPPVVAPRRAPPARPSRAPQVAPRPTITASTSQPNLNEYAAVAASTSASASTSTSSLPPPSHLGSLTNNRFSNSLNQLPNVPPPGLPRSDSYEDPRPRSYSDDRSFEDNSSPTSSMHASPSHSPKLTPINPHMPRSNLALPPGLQAPTFASGKRKPSVPAPMPPPGTVRVSPYIMLKIISPEDNAASLLLFSVFSTVEEVRQQVIPRIWYDSNVQAPPSGTHRKYQLRTRDGKWLDTRKMISSFGLEDGDSLELFPKEAPSSIVKVSMESGARTALMCDDWTTGFDVCLRVLQKMNKGGPLKEIGDSPDLLGLYMPSETMEIAVGDEDLLSSHNIGSSQELILKPLPASTSLQATSMILKVMSSDGFLGGTGKSRNITMIQAGPHDTVELLHRRIIKKHTIPEWNQFTLHQSTSSGQCGPELLDSLSLEEAGLKNGDSLQLRKLYRQVTINLPLRGQIVLKFDESTTVQVVYDMLFHNYASTFQQPQHSYALFTSKTGQMLEASDMVWSYALEEGLDFKSRIQNLSVIANGVEEVVHVDYYSPLTEAMPIVFDMFEFPELDSTQYTLQQSGLSGVPVSVSKSLIDQGVTPPATLLLKVIDREVVGGVRDSVCASVSIWDEPTSVETVVIEANGDIQAATLNKLIEHLTSPSGHDLEFRSAFFMTYRSFTTPSILLSKLIDRYDVPVSQASVSKPVKLRVANCLKFWLENHFEDFSSSVLLEKLMTFVDQNLGQDTPLGKKFHKIIEKKRSRSLSRRKTSVFVTSESEVMASKRSKKNEGILDFPDEAIAETLTVIAFDIYAGIKGNELLGQAWSKEKTRHRCPNVMEMIDRFNAVSLWVAATILEPTKVKVRAKRFERLIRIADHLYKLNNFQTLMAFLGGFNNSCVARLKYTRMLVPRALIKKLEELEKVMNMESSFKIYRQHLKMANPPIIPYLGVYLSDLTFIEDGNQDEIKGLINFSKRKLLHMVISQLQRYQNDRPKFVDRLDLTTLLYDINAQDENA